MTNSFHRSFLFLGVCLGWLTVGCDDVQRNGALSPATVGSNQAPIINGDDESAEQSGFVQVDTSAKLCSGVLLANSWILTAKHCTFKPDGKTPVAAAELSLTMGSQTIKAYQIIRYDSLDADQGIDAALIRAQEPFKMSGSTSGYHSQLYAGSMTTLVGESVTCHGYGANAPDSSGYGKLRQATVMVSNVDTMYVTVDVNVKGQAPFHGDSGGPCLFEHTDHSKTIVGITQGPALTGSDVPPVYLVSADAIRSWVQDTTTWPYQFESVKACTNVIDGACVGEKTVFEWNEKVYALARLKNVWVNHRYAVDFYRNGAYVDGEETVFNDVGTSGWSISYYWARPDWVLYNVRPGNWQAKFFIDTGDGKGWVKFATQSFTVKEQPSYRFIASDMCTSVTGPDGAGDYACKDPKRAFKAGEEAYIWTKFEDLVYDFRFKIVAYKDGILFKEIMSSWFTIGIFGKPKFYFYTALSSASATVGKWKFDIYIEANDGKGKGLQLATSESYDVVP